MVNHVAPKYRFGGAPIAVVQAQPLLYRDAVVDGIAFTRPPLRQVGGRITDFEPSGSTIAYVFCGQAQRCACPRKVPARSGPSCSASRSSSPSTRSSTRRTCARS